MKIRRWREISGALIVGFLVAIGIVAIQGAGGADPVANPLVSFGTKTCVTNSSGYCSGIIHGLGVVPDSVTATGKAPITGSAIPAQILTDSFTTTTFRVRALSNSGSVLNTKTITFSWHADASGVVSTPTPTPTTTDITTSTPTPSDTTTTPPTNGFPDSTNTGVPAGTVLTAYTGSCNLPTNTVIDAKTINCYRLTISGSGVSITKSVINGIVYSEHGATPSSSVSITDSYINGGNQETYPSVSYDSVTLLRVEVVGGQHSVQCSSNCTVTDSYLHGQYIGASSAGHVNAFISNGGSGFTLTHNTLWCSVSQTSNDGGCTADASLFGDFDFISNAKFDRNLFHETDGSYCLYSGWEPPKAYPIPSNVSVTNNVFQRGITPGQHGFTCGYYGSNTSYYPGNGDVWSGNVYDDGTVVSPG